MSSYFECYYGGEREGVTFAGMLCDVRRYHFDTFAAYDHAMTLMQNDFRIAYIILAEDREQINAGYYYKFAREDSGDITFHSHTPHFCEKVSFSNICDYFRKPVYRRTANVEARHS